MFYAKSLTLLIYISAKLFPLTDGFWNIAGKREFVVGVGSIIKLKTDVLPS